MAILTVTQMRDHARRHRHKERRFDTNPENRKRDHVIVGGNTQWFVARSGYTSDANTLPFPDLSTVELNVQSPTDRTTPATFT